MDSMKVYTTAVKTANFSLAAQQLNLSPSAVSKQISQLEKTLGVRLLNRTTRSISPTEAGTLYYNRCMLILEAIQETNAMVKDLESCAFGYLPFLADLFFPELPPIFAKNSQTLI